MNWGRGKVEALMKDSRSYIVIICLSCSLPMRELESSSLTKKLRFMGSDGRTKDDIIEGVIGKCVV